VVFAVALVFDQLLDGFITPRIMASALRVHPAAVLVSAFVFADLLGVVGIIIAAPMLATAILFGRYTMRKMLDQNPWPEQEEEKQPSPLPWAELATRIRKTLGLLPRKTQNSFPDADSTDLPGKDQSQGENL
jgi:hypothetical protein